VAADALQPPPASSPPVTTLRGDGPKRNKSLMQRIRKMRDSPNVPVGNYEAQVPVPPSPTSYESGYDSRPQNRQQNSFMGRFGAQPKENISPTAETFDRGKNLPQTPTPYEGQDGVDYFDGDVGGSNGYNTSPGGGMGRKTSILNKVKGVVRGPK